MIYLHMIFALEFSQVDFCSSSIPVGMWVVLWTMIFPDYDWCCLSLILSQMNTMITVVHMAYMFSTPDFTQFIFILLHK